MESAEIIKCIRCTVLSNDGLSVEAIKNIFQIYEFDQILISLHTDRVYEFEIPLSEWLAELVRIINLHKLGLFQKKLPFSGYDFSVFVESKSVILNIRDISDYNHIIMIILTRSQIFHVIEFMRNFLITLYEKHGGNRNDLEDLDRYTLV